MEDDIGSIEHVVTWMPLLGAQVTTMSLPGDAPDLHAKFARMLGSRSVTA
jgi:hypothetical protein